MKYLDDSFIEINHKFATLNDEKKRKKLLICETRNASLIRLKTLQTPLIFPDTFYELLTKEAKQLSNSTSLEIMLAHFYVIDCLINVLFCFNPVIITFFRYTQ